MSETLNREELIALLNRLGGEDDAEVLQAAREAHARVAASGLGWDGLLVPGQVPCEASQPEDRDLAAGGEEPAPEDPGRDADSLALIRELLARSDISQELRQELEGYEADIAAGEFVEADRRYLRAMHRRLSK